MDCCGGGELSVTRMIEKPRINKVVRDKKKKRFRCCDTSEDEKKSVRNTVAGWKTKQRKKIFS